MSRVTYLGCLNWGLLRSRHKEGFKCARKCLCEGEQGGSWRRLGEHVPQCECDLQWKREERSLSERTTDCCAGKSGNVIWEFSNQRWLSEEPQTPRNGSASLSQWLGEAWLWGKEQLHQNAPAGSAVFPTDGCLRTSSWLPCTFYTLEGFLWRRDLDDK